MRLLAIGRPLGLTLRRLLVGGVLGGIALRLLTVGRTLGLPL